MRRILIQTVILLGVAQVVFAGRPAPGFSRPVRLDQSGRPVYNSWERQDFQKLNQPQSPPPRQLRDDKLLPPTPSKSISTDGSSESLSGSGTLPNNATKAAGPSAIQLNPSPVTPVNNVYVPLVQPKTGDN